MTPPAGGLVFGQQHDTVDVLPRRGACHQIGVGGSGFVDDVDAAPLSAGAVGEGESVRGHTLSLGLSARRRGGPLGKIFFDLVHPHPVGMRGVHLDLETFCHVRGDICQIYVELLVPAPVLIDGTVLLSE